MKKSFCFLLILLFMIPLHFYADDMIYGNIPIGVSSKDMGYIYATYYFDNNVKKVLPYRDITLLAMFVVNDSRKYIAGRIPISSAHKRGQFNFRIKGGNIELFGIEAYNKTLKKIECLSDYDHILNVEKGKINYIGRIHIMMEVITNSIGIMQGAYTSEDWTFEIEDGFEDDAAIIKEQYPSLKKLQIVNKYRPMMVPYGHEVFEDGTTNFTYPFLRGNVKVYMNGSVAIVETSKFDTNKRVEFKVEGPLLESIKKYKGMNVVVKARTYNTSMTSGKIDVFKILHVKPYSVFTYQKQ